jgi:hypothetical protein
MKYHVKNWRTFQHYRDRNPPWIKLHFALLTSSDWVVLADSARVLAIVCMLVASRNNGEIDGSDKGLAYLQRVGYLNKKPDLKPLIECGFLQSASKTLAIDGESARPETEDLTEKKPTTTTAARIEFDPLKGAFQNITEEQELAWQEAFPAVPIPPAISRAAVWLKANPENRKSNYARFLVNWFTREQDRAGRVRAVA